MSKRGKEQDDGGLGEQARRVRGEDSLQNAAQITGQPDPNLYTVGVGWKLFQDQNKQKRLLFGELGDTHRETTWQQFEQIITDNGFEIIQRIPYQIPPFSDKENLIGGEQLFAAHRQKKLLIISSSIYETGKEKQKINTAHVLGVADKGDISREDWINLTLNPDGAGGSWSAYIDNPNWFDLFGNEGLLTNIALLEEAGLEFIDWHNIHTYIHFLTPGDEMIIGDLQYLNKLRRDEFFQNAPQWVRDFML